MSMNYASETTSGSPVIVDGKELTPLELWKVEINYAEKELNKFYERARKVIRKYVDEREAMDSASKWFNLFHANTNILKAALYAQMPQPEVKRKYLDYNDDIARAAALMLQRAITPDGDDPRDLFDVTMRNCVLDRLLSGLAIAWCRLETDTEEVELMAESIPSVGEEQYGPSHHDAPLNSGFKLGPAPDEQKAQTAALAPTEPPPPGEPPPPIQQAQPQTYKRITDQRVAIDYTYWEDFLWSPCRVWEERRWVARVVYMDKPALEKRFGKDKAALIPLNHKPSSFNLNTYPSSLTPNNMAIQRAKIYEIWDRCYRKVIWISKDCPQILDEKDDFLNLIGFEPCPKPMFANITTSNTVPRPDYYMVQDQYAELDTINNRISKLVQACKVAGIYDRSADGVQRLLLEGVDNKLMPVDNWAMFAEKGGVKGQVDWLPLEQIINTLQRLYEARESIKAQIYEMTGIADIVRGASKASETLGAQEIKAKFASVRIKDVQDEVARFAADILRIKAELMIKHFDPEIMIRKSNILRTDDAHLAQEAIQMLQSEEGFEWRIVVTSDQLAQADYAMEKQDRVELLTAASSYMEKAAMMLQAQPQAAPLLVGLLKWAVAGFKGAREIEGMLDQQLDQLIKQPPEDKPDPEQQKAEMEAKAAQQKMAMEQQKGQIQMQTATQKAQLEQQKGQQELMLKRQLAVMELRMKEMDLQFKIKELELKEREMMMDLNFAEAEAARNERTSLLEQQMQLEADAARHKQESQFSQESHVQKLRQAKQTAAQSKRTLQ